jgi:hypothetical protein
MGLIIYDQQAIHLKVKPELRHFQGKGKEPFHSSRESQTEGTV